jgi:hypothetical protein
MTDKRRYSDILRQRGPTGESDIVRNPLVWLYKAAGDAFLAERLLILGELVGEAIILLFTPFGVRANEISSSSEMEIWMVVGVKEATGAGPQKMSSCGIDPNNMKSSCGIDPNNMKSSCGIDLNNMMSSCGSDGV